MIAEAIANAAMAKMAIAGGTRFARRILLPLIVVSPAGSEPAAGDSSDGSLETPSTQDRFAQPLKTSWLLPMEAIRQVTAPATAMPPMCRGRAGPTVVDEPGREPVQRLKRQAHEQS